MKLGTKIILGFMGLILLAMILGGIAIFMMNNVQKESTILAKEYIPEVMMMTDVTRETFTMRYNVLGIALSGEKRFVDGAAGNYAKLQDEMTKFRALVDNSENLVKGRVAAKDLTENIAKYWAAAQVLAKSKEDLLDNLKQQGAKGRGLKEASDALVARIAKRIEETTAANLGTLKVEMEKLSLGKKMVDAGLQLRLDGAAAVRDDNMERLRAGIKSASEAMNGCVKRMQTISGDDVALMESVKKIEEMFADYRTLLEDNDKLIDTVKSNTKSTAAIGNDIIKLSNETSDVASKGTMDKAESTNSELMTAILVLAIGLLIAFVVGLTMALVITRGITGPVNRIISSLNEAGEQVAAASGQISSASQSLAEGATEQAASLEESSSALEEMASMTRQNADNAVTANQNMTQTQSQVSIGADAVRNMSKAMDEINDSSEKISRIIKTIEEIAFQTNLLALNAAVEAARAGDAGKGFAVVADEVRNLAQRSAQAARDTAELIESTVARVKNGTEIVQQLQKSFVDVETAANSVAGLINEISAASNEQAQGVDQVNTAVAQMDKVTQTNAANAEESASAAEELNAQAEQLRGLVNELVKIVRGNEAMAEVHLRPHLTHTAANNKPALRAPASSHKSLMTSHTGQGAAGGLSPRKRLPTSSGDSAKGGASVVKPNQVIPLDDDDDFNDF